MPKTKARKVAKPKASTSSKATELVDITEEVENPQNESKLSTILEEFEFQFAYRLRQYDLLLEEKLAALNKEKERLKIRRLKLLGSTLEPKYLTNNKENTNPTALQSSSRGKCAPTTENANSSQGLQGKRMTRSKQKNNNSLLPYAENAFQTPAISSSVPSVPIVTPKVALNTPISMLRLPRQGEMALSLSGSPVMVTAMSHENKPNINVPLKGGQVLSLIPHENLDPNSVADLELDEEAKKQLMALKQNLLAFINITK